MKPNLFHRLWNHPIHWRALLIRLWITSAVLAAIVFLGYYWGQHIPAVEAFISGLGIWGPIIFILLFVALMPFFVPNAGFAIVAGALFGLWWGSVIIIIAGLISELSIFTAGHRFLRGHVENVLCKHTKLLAIRSALTKKPIRLMILMRLSPLPFTPICYMLSTTRISYRDYIIGYLGYIPGNVVTVYFGVVAKHMAKIAGGAESISVQKMVLALAALLASIALITYVSHISRKAIDEVEKRTS
jgi:uncharacterized membrane protein YdjX (TVP38/TMEM64 family)